MAQPNIVTKVKAASACVGQHVRFEDTILNRPLIGTCINYTRRSVSAIYVCATRIAKAERRVNVVASYLPGALSELWIQHSWVEK